MKLSIICSHYNEPNSLKSILIPSFNGFGPDAELIIVDDGSDSFNRSILSSISFSEKKRIKVIDALKIKRISGGVSRARMAGALEASGEYLLFVDAHSELPKNLIGVAAKAVCLYDDVFICGKYINKTNNVTTLGSGATFKFFAQCPETMEILDVWRVDRKANTHYTGPVQAPIGANYLVSKKLFLHYNGLAGMVRWCQFEAYMAMLFHKLHSGVVVFDELQIIHHELPLSGAKGNTTAADLVFNKMFCIWMFMPDEVWFKWSMLMPQLFTVDHYKVATHRLDCIKHLYSDFKKHAQFTSHELDLYCDRWQVAHPMSI